MRELGRASEAVDVMIDDDVIFAGCWRVRTKQAGKLVHAGALVKSDDRGASMEWPSNIATLPYIIRRAVPVIVTLDGAVCHPQVEGVASALTSTETAFSARFLGL